MTRIAVFGATGRMGQTLVRLIAADDRLQLAGAATEPGHTSVGQDAGLVAGVGQLDVKITDNPEAAVTEADVAIDFTLPAALAGNVAACLANQTGMVIGTTGLGDTDMTLIRDAAKHIPLVYGRNMSVGVNLLAELARLASQVLGEDFDVEINEAHHRHKVDAPSGTALLLGEAVADGRGAEFADVAVYERHGVGEARKSGSIGFASLRAGSIVGDHTVMFAS
ncbi:MAG: 4-hydroxy-tetrahydrodipicolinate reductase, partial [Gammaproteobacteria bacterium]|nr:4-hydroxy-tetrahydrodipicolinate reductase [Gammaproteobacteria bacterium]